MNITIPAEFYRSAAPLFVLAIAALITMMQSVSKNYGKASYIRLIVLVSLALSFLGLFFVPASVEQVFLDGSFVSQALSKIGSILIIGSALVVTACFSATHMKEQFFRGEIASLFLLVVLGMLLMVSSDEIITIFIGLEISSIGLYALIGYISPTRRSLEGAIKYLILGSFATAFLLFGLALIYAQTGTLKISETVQALNRISEQPWIKLGGIFIIVGLSFKLALAPFHLWAPDAYESAPTGITAFMATAGKTTVLIVLLRFLTEGLSQMNDSWTPALVFLASMSVVVGNVMALVQTSLKRILAYSSVAHSGYIAIAVAAIGYQSNENPAAAALFYLIGYTIISLGIFSLLMWFEGHEIDNIQLDDLSGIAKRHPLASFGFSCLIFSLAGFPPSVGFISKFFVFSAALGSGFYWLALIGVLGSSVSLFFYLRILVKMYMEPSLPTGAAIMPQKSWVIGLLSSAAIAANLLLGTVSPGQLMNVAKNSIRSIQAK